MNNEKFTKAKYGEWLLSLTGACLIAGAIGVLVAPYLSPTVVFAVLLLGVILHTVGMYKIHQRNK